MNRSEDLKICEAATELALKLEKASLPDPHDEREVMNATLLRDSALCMHQLIKQAQRCEELESRTHALQSALKDVLQLWLEDANPSELAGVVTNAEELLK